MDKKDRIIDVIVSISSVIKKGEGVSFVEKGEEVHHFKGVELGETIFLLEGEKVYGLMEVAEMFKDKEIKEIHYYLYNSERGNKVWGHRIFNAPKFN